MSRTATCVVAVALLVCACAEARIHDLTITTDSRAVFGIEDFGFVSGGTIQMDVSGFKVITDGSAEEPYSIGFFLEEIGSESDGIEMMERFAAGIQTKCPLNENNVLMDMGSKKSWESSSYTRSILDAGLYIVGFARCTPVTASVSFELKLKMYNPGPDYLSVGNRPLPPLFMVASVIYLGLLAVWIMHIRKHPTKTHNVHHMMTVLLVFKLLSLFFEGVTWFNVQSHGSPVGWNVLYYIFAFLKGIFLFVVVLLVGTGWSLLKPFLNDREKKILVIVLSLQVVDNIAIIVVAEMAPGSVAFGRWGDLLHLVDIICCCAVLLPIVWSIRHLRQAAGADGKARNTLARLTQFRQFYVMVVGYIYFTRIIVYLVEIALTYKLTWLGPFFAEIATLVFFTLTGYKFRPTADNPYLRVRNEDDDADEFGLDDDDEESGTGAGAGDIEMTSKPTPADD